MLVAALAQRPCGRADEHHGDPVPMTPKRKKGMTLAEHDALLKAEGRYDAMIDRQRQQEEIRQKYAAELSRDEAPLVTQLRAAGFAVNSVWDLVNTNTAYP